MSTCCRRIPRVAFQTLRVDLFCTLVWLSIRKCGIDRETKYACDNFEATREDSNGWFNWAHRDDSGREVRVPREAGRAAHISHNPSRAANGSREERATTPCVCSSQRWLLLALWWPEESNQLGNGHCMAGLLVWAVINHYQRWATSWSSYSITYTQIWWLEWPNRTPTRTAASTLNDAAICSKCTTATITAFTLTAALRASAKRTNCTTAVDWQWVTKQLTFELDGLLVHLAAFPDTSDLFATVDLCSASASVSFVWANMNYSDHYCAIRSISLFIISFERFDSFI